MTTPTPAGQTYSNSSNPINWITIEQVQRKLKISRSTVYRWIKNEAIRAYRFRHSKIVFFNEAEIDNFLSHNPITPGGRLDKTALIELH